VSSSHGKLLGHVKTRAERRAHGRRGGEVARLVHGPHDRAWLFSGTLNASGQQRINHKRNRRAAFWRTVRVRVSAELEPRVRETIGLLGPGVRVCGRSEVRGSGGLAVDLHVHVPYAPAGAVAADVVYGHTYDGSRYGSIFVHELTWYGADGDRIEVAR